MNDILFAQKKTHMEKLKKIEQEIEDRNKELEEYVNKVEDLKKQIDNIKKDSQTNAAKKQELESLINRTQENIISIKNSYETLKKTYSSIIDDMRLDVSSLYVKSYSFSDYYGRDTIAKSIILRNAIINKHLIANNLDKKAVKTRSDLNMMISKKEKIAMQKQAILSKLEKNKKTMNQTAKEIENNKKRLKKLQEEIDRLKSSAKELNNLVKKLEKKSPYKTSAHTYIDIPKKSLPWPIKGKIISYFGKEYVNDLKTWIVREGIRIKANAGYSVKPVMAGEVIYCGEFRNYGKIVIVRHEDNIFTTYGLLSSINVKNGDKVDINTDIGMVGEDLQAVDTETNDKNVLYFEIRSGSDALNPMDWLKE